MLFYVLFSVAVSFSRRQAVALLTAVLFALATVPTIVGGDLTTPWSVWTNPLICEFAFGMWIGIALREGWRLPLWACAGLAAAGLALMIYTYAHDFVPVSRTIGWGGGAALVVAAIVLADTEMAAPAALRPLVLIGDASYALYLVHTMVSPALVLLRVPRVVDPAQWPILYCVIVVAVSIGAALALNLIDSKVRAALLRRLPGGARPNKASKAGSAV
jgi:peptidoglycan/LPS O-acetylase OafA/YrhL